MTWTPFSRGSRDCSTLPLFWCKYFGDCRHAMHGPGAPACAMHGPDTPTRATRDPRVRARTMRSTDLGFTLHPTPLVY
jgi:hypothetical protein